MLNLLRTRLPFVTALVLTILAFYGLLSRQSFDAEWMLRWNHVDSGQVQLVYAVLIAVLLLALLFAPRIQTVLERGSVVVFIVAAVASFLSITLLEPNQEHRLFVSPFSIWIIIVHIVGLSALLVWSVMRSSHLTDGLLSKRRQSLLCYVLVVIVGLLGILYFVGRADFMPLDLPDEPYNASIATNYAQNNDLSGQYIGSAYGSPDVVFPRYYWVMGLWLKLEGNISLAAQRAFPVLVGLAALAVLLLGLWRLRHAFGLTPVHLLIAAVALLSMSTFLRTTHNLRMDVLLALYSSLMLWGMLGFWQSDDGFKNKSSKIGYLMLMGAALFFGMEAIPLAAVPMSVATGIMLIVWWLRQPQKRHSFRYVVIYTVACAIGIFVYYLFQLLPDIADSWLRYRAFVQNYSGATGVGTVRLPLDSLINSIGRFNLILSPLELITCVVAVVSLWRMKVSAERWLLASVGLGFVLLVILFRLSYSYMVVFAPFMAYAIARVIFPWRQHISPLMTVFLVALIAVPVTDLIWSIQTRTNQSRLETLDVLTPQFPTGTTIIGEDVFWFTLNDHRAFMGINGFVNYTGIKHVDYLTALRILKVDALLCDKNTTQCQAFIDTQYFGSPTEYQVGNSTYLIYWRLNS